MLSRSSKYVISISDVLDVLVGFRTLEPLAFSVISSHVKSAIYDLNSGAMNVEPKSGNRAYVVG